MSLTKYRLLASVLPLVILGLSLVLINRASININTHKANLDQIEVKQQTLEEAVSLNQYLEANSIHLEQLSSSLPSESMMMAVVQDLESVVRRYDSAGNIKIAAATTAKIGTDSVIPLTVTVTTDPSQIIPLLTDLVNLPYIIQLLNMDIQFNGSNAQLITNLRMYVQDPFIGY